MAGKRVKAPAGYHWMKKGQEVQKIIPDGEYWIFNTGITGGGSDTIKKLDIHKHYEEFKKLDVQQNNEVFLTWLVKKEKFPLTQLPEWWHYNCLRSDDKIANACMWHVTDKNFERVSLMKMEPNAVQDWHIDGSRKCVLIYPLTDNYAKGYTRNHDLIESYEGVVLLDVTKDHAVFNNEHTRINLQISFDEVVYDKYWHRRR